MLKHITSIWNRDNRNNINNAIDVLNQLGVRVQDLVAEGQLTPAQYAELIKEVNGLISKGHVKLNDLSPEILEAINNSDGTPFEILSIPRDKSVTKEKTTFIEMSTNLFNSLDGEFMKNIDEETGEIIGITINRYVTPFFDIKPNSNYRSSNLTIRAFYDSSKAFINSTRGNGTFTTPSNAHYMRIATDNYDSAQLNEGEVLLPYEQYYRPKLAKDIEIYYEVPNKSITSDKIATKAIGINELSISAIPCATCPSSRTTSITTFPFEMLTSSLLFHK